MKKLALCALALSCLAALSPLYADGDLQQRAAEFADIPLPKEIGAVPRVRAPLYVMEYHIWYTSPFGQEGRYGYDHGGPHEYADTAGIGPDWMRSRMPIGYPLVGPYHSEDTNVIRWQIRCMKNTGVDGAFVQFYPEWVKGDFFIREEVFANILNIAEEEGFKIGIHDEVMFRRGQPAQQPDVMVKRISDIIRKYGRHPAFLRIKGRPSYTFQYWDKFQGKMQPELLSSVMQRVNKEVGENVFWIPYHSVDTKSVLDMKELGGLVVLANSNNQFRKVLENFDSIPKEKRAAKMMPGYTPDPLPVPINDMNLAKIRAARQAYPGLMFGLWGYPGFENSTQRGSRADVDWLPRNGGKTLVDVLRQFDSEKIDFMMISSWNDWEENTAMEPGLNYEGYRGDPYLYCRILAAAKGVKFTPPPLPPKESVDPWMWQPLYGIDKRPPEITRARYLPLEPGMIVSVVDSVNAVAEARMMEEGDVSLSVGSDGKLIKKGIVAVDPSQLAPEGGLLMEANKKFVVTIDPKLVGDVGDKLYIALEYVDAGKGRITINYPAKTPLIDYKPSDERKYRVGPIVNLQQDGKWKVAVRQMRGVELRSQPLPLELNFRPVRGESTTAPIRLMRLHVFGTMKQTQPGLEVSFAPKESQEKVYRFVTPDLKGGGPKAVYVLAKDSEGNITAPVAIGPDGPVEAAASGY